MNKEIKPIFYTKALHISLSDCKFSVTKYRQTCSF